MFQDLLIKIPTLYTSVAAQSGFGDEGDIYPDEIEVEGDIKKGDYVRPREDRNRIGEVPIDEIAFQSYQVQFGTEEGPDPHQDTILLPSLQPETDLYVHKREVLIDDEHTYDRITGSKSKEGEANIHARQCKRADRGQALKRGFEALKRNAESAYLFLGQALKRDVYEA